ncbi:MAG: RagB/SusD family nutrient uptake outer membrane protein [Bacteroides sp.]|nr:RagB/SusD family nutrient uptake outer membrane protein [Bacteroides sp.]
MVTKGACCQLLIKCYLTLGRFDEAIEQADILINQSGYELMTDNFGTFVNPMPEVWNIARNVIWDLHYPENKCITANKEAILSMPNRNESVASRLILRSMRNAVPMWIQTGALGIYAPDGTQNAIVSGMNTDWGYRKTLGRGIARIRPTHYVTHGLWIGDETDLRHNTEVGNWITMESLVYNGLPESHHYYKKNLQLFSEDGILLCGDTIRSWFDWPHYKVWVEHPQAETANNYDGGAGDLYCYRLAETYLLRAEAKVWKGDFPGVAADVNTVRRRVQCSKLFDASEMNMGIVMDERARELYYEELRHVELSRVSYIFALTGKTDEFGQRYTIEGLETNSYWYQRITAYNNYYNKGVVTRSGVEYTIAPYHIYWPVPQTALEANREGILNQNKGYTGYENNIIPWDNLEEAMKDEITAIV